MTTEQKMRRALIALATLVLVSTPVELWLAEHMEEWQQYMPFALCGLGLFAIAAATLFPQPRTVWIARGVMVALVGGGVLGMYLHVAGNFAFELEIRPNATASDVIMDALQGANPLLAPGILAFAGLIVLIATLNHPAFNDN